MLKSEWFPPFAMGIVLAVLSGLLGIGVMADYPNDLVAFVIVVGFVILGSLVSATCLALSYHIYIQKKP